jgi:hypothetical protein
MAVFTIPVSNQNQTVKVSILNIVYNLRLVWNQFGNCWYLDIADVNNNSIISSLRLLPGFNILKQFKYLGIGGGLFAQNIGNINAPPGFNDLGLASFLFFIPGD